MCALAFQKLCLNLNLMLSVNCWKNIYSCSALVFRSLSDTVHVMWLLSSMYKNYSEHLLFWILTLCTNATGSQVCSHKRTKEGREHTGGSHLLTTVMDLSGPEYLESVFSLPGVFGHSPSISKNSDIVHCPPIHPMSCSSYLSYIRSVRSEAGETLSVFCWFYLNVLYILAAWFLQPFLQGMYNK